MKDGEAAEPRFLLTVFAALWVMAFVYSFVAFLTTVPEETGRNHISAFLGWQGVAGILALCVFGVSRSWPKTSIVRRNGAVPVILAGLLVLGLLVVIVGATITT